MNEPKQTYLEQLLDSMRSANEKAFDLIEKIQVRFGSHEVECEKRYAEMRAELAEIKALVKQRNEERAKRNKNGKPVSLARAVLQYIGEKPLVPLVLLLSFAAILHALATIDPEVIKAILGK